MPTIAALGIHILALLGRQVTAIPPGYNTVFKMGAQGSSIASRDGEIRIPALQVPVVDSTGCGDACCAGFIAGLGMGWSVDEAGRLGTAAAGLVITGLGSDAL